MFLHFQTSRQLNQDSAGKSRSVGLWVYQFKSADAIMAATFDSVWVQGGAALNPTLAARPDHVTFLPGEQAVRRLRRQPNAAYVALAANFRNGSQGWKSVVRLPPPVDPCSQPNDRPRPPPLRLHVYLQDFWIRVQTNFHIPSTAQPRAATPPPQGPMLEPVPSSQPDPLPQPAPPQPAPAPANESPGWLDPTPQ